MFGYIKPFNPQLKVCELEAYKAVYCGLCGQMGESFGALSRLTLSFDLTFLCLLAYCVEYTPLKLKQGRCFANPMKKKLIVQGDEVLRFSADVAVIMLYYKLSDNMLDNGYLSKMGWGILYPPVSVAHKKAIAANPECRRIISSAMEKQTELEVRKDKSVDEAAQPTAQALSEICELLSEKPDTKRILRRIGYCVGRYVYLCDALDDLEKDLAKGRYNPFALAWGIEKDHAISDVLLEKGRESIYATIAECAKAFNLLDPGPFEPVIANIFSMGMHSSVKEIFARKGKSL